MANAIGIRPRCPPDAVHLIRSLLSENRLVHEYVDPRLHKTVVLEKPGPTGLILSTTHAALIRISKRGCFR